MKNRMRKIVLLIICAVMSLAMTGCGGVKIVDTGLIGKPKAKEIALQDAGFPSRWVIELKAEHELADGQIVYDVSFINATTKYSYVIDGATGDILDSQTAPLFGSE